MKRRYTLALAIILALTASCSLPVSVQEDDSESLGERNAKLLQERVDELGPELWGIRVYFGIQLENVLREFSIDGEYLIEWSDQVFYNLTEMVSMSVEESGLDSPSRVIVLRF